MTTEMGEAPAGFHFLCIAHGLVFNSTGSEEPPGTSKPSADPENKVS